MPNKKQREQNRQTYRKLMEKVSTARCPHCDQRIPPGHYVVPCFGDEGFFTCKAKDI